MLPLPQPRVARAVDGDGRVVDTDLRFGLYRGRWRRCRGWRRRRRGGLRLFVLFQLRHVVQAQLGQDMLEESRFLPYEVSARSRLKHFEHVDGELRLGQVALDLPRVRVRDLSHLLHRRRLERMDEAQEEVLPAQLTLRPLPLFPTLLVHPGSVPRINGSAPRAPW